MSSLSDLFKKAEQAHRHPLASSPQVSSPRRVWSPDQERFLQSAAPKMLLSALAGSGKSSLLMEYARRRPHQKWNFLVFNRSVAELWASQCPRNVRIQTVHQLAFSRFGAPLQHKIKDNLTWNDVPVPAWISNHPPVQQKMYLNSLLEGVENFCLSSDEELSIVHCPHAAALAQKVADFTSQTWVTDIQFLWQNMLDEKHPCLISHSVYAKRFCMSDAPWMGDHWMLDEAQDWSNALLNAFLKHAPVSIRAGDPFQRIYQWRGASASPWHDSQREYEFWISKSFRTGSGPEDWVNWRLDALGAPRRWEPANGQHCSVILDNQNVQNILAFAPQVILGAQWKELEMLGHELAGRGLSVRRLDQPGPVCDVLISTIHSAKGMEFERVWIMDESLLAYEEQAHNNSLAYVALTRARKEMRIPPSWPRLITNQSAWQNAFE